MKSKESRAPHLGHSLGGSDWPRRGSDATLTRPNPIATRPFRKQETRLRATSLDEKVSGSVTESAYEASGSEPTKSGMLYIVQTVRVLKGTRHIFFFSFAESSASLCREERRWGKKGRWRTSQSQSARDGIGPDGGGDADN